MRNIEIGRGSQMKNRNYLNYRSIPLYGSLGDEYNGAFVLKIQGLKVFVIASKGGGWEHVSVSIKDIIPSWEIMCEVKDIFFEYNETVMQLHPAKEDYVNVMSYCLHLWRPINKEIPMPPKFMV